MKHLLIATLSVVAASAPVAAQRFLPGLEPLANVLPAGGAVDEYTITADGRRVYYSTTTGEVWLYDRRQKRTARIADGGQIWDLTVSANGSVLCFTRSGEGKREEFVCTVPLDPRTGLATRPQRRATMTEGDAAAFSADGQWLAFARNDSGGRQSLVVLPAAGGPERTLASMPAGINVIRWSPDAKSIYFTVNAARTLHLLDEQIERVPVSGGTPQIVGVSSQGWPSLSLDGKYLVFRDTGLTRAYVVADANGRRLTRFTPPPGMSAELWQGGSTLVLARDWNPWALRAYSIANGADKVLADTIGRLHSQTWSADGKRIAYGLQIGLHYWLVIADAQGRTSRVIPLRQAILNVGDWSPDGKWVLYRNGGVSESPAIAVEVSSGRQIELPETKQGHAVLWKNDSRHLIDIGPAVPTRTGPQGDPIFVREADITGSGSTRVIREIKTGAGRPWAGAIDESFMLVKRSSDQPVMMEPVDGSRAGTQVFPAGDGFFAGPVVSPDRKWVALRRNPQSEDNSRMNVVEVVPLDGTAHTTLNLPFFAAPGKTLFFLPGDKQIVIAEDSRGKKDPSVYLVTVATGEVKKLFGLRLLPNQVPEMSVSPDGKTILYVNRDLAAPAYATVDVARLAAGNQ